SVSQHRRRDQGDGRGRGDRPGRRDRGGGRGRPERVGPGLDLSGSPHPREGPRPHSKRQGEPMSRPLTVAAVQLASLEGETLDHALAVATSAVDAALARGATLVVLPEIWTPGYFAFDT